MSGTPAFGRPTDDLGDAEDILTVGLEDGPAPEEIPAPEAAPAPEVTTEDTSSEPAPELNQEDQGSTEVEATEAQKLLAGKYASPEELERGYREQSRLLREHAERARVAEQRAAQIEAAARQLLEEQQTKAQAQPKAEGSEPSDAQLAAWGIDRATYQTLRPIIEAQVNSVVAPITEQMTVAQRQQAEALERQRIAEMTEARRQAAQRNLEDFYSRHTEYAPGSDGHFRIAELVESWNRQWTGDPSGAAEGSVNVADPEMLEILAEAALDPALAQVLRFNPQYVEDDEGMALARHQARILAASKAPTQGSPKSPAAPLPAVETGASGGGPRQLDAAPRTAIDEILDLAKQEKRSAFLR